MAFSAKKSLPAVVLCAAMMWTVTGCSSPADNEPASETSQTAADASHAVTITDITGNTIQLENPLEHAAIQLSGSGGPLLTMAALDRDNYTSKIAAMDKGLESNRQDLWDLLLEANPELADIPKIGDATKDQISAEQLLTMGVDGVIAPVRQKAKMDVIAEQTGIPVIYIDYHSQKLENHIQSTKIIAEATGLTKNVDEITKFYEDVVGDIEERASKLDRTTSVYFETTSNGPTEFGNTYGAGIMWGAILDAVGADNIATHFMAADDAEALSAEQVLVSNPDKIVLSGSLWANQPDSVKMGFSVSNEEALASMEPFRQREGWDKLKAIQNNELYAIGHPMTREMLDFYSYAQLAKLFHPEEFADLDPEALIKEYFDKYMPIPYEGTWFIKYE
ncbi:ABC transporter substrate-binding protein [Corynebacterium sp. CCUG 61414]|uniref:ABC transporter substrate-binding protein n=1 Tax=Corynebacterium sp. CCUG 61414 TaxID=2823896 RepID=UPI002109B79B|nr:ABC transporter substrate-binding protein [Corynebacterium sp. CCUG 61414]MCQ4610015.1 ABC transporter substrate-binding protein [Corynebacterium sp. CCUG 61414]